MTVLEDAVQNLAIALENLESRLDGRLDDLSVQNDEVAAAKRQAITAKKHAGDASRGLSASISDLKTLLDNNSAAKEKIHGGS